mgnify:CR=1 FL=1
MEPDVMLVSGMGLIVLSLPAMLSAWADGRAPRVGALVFLGGGGLVLWALRAKEGGYRLSEIPDVFYGVVGQTLN